MTTLTTVVPVLDGERYLEELLDALAREAVDQVIVVDSGSRDASVQIARRAGAELIEIPAAAFGHGSTRNLATDRARGELVCFLTQDATPCPGWRDAYEQAFSGDPRIAAAYGPHLPRPGTSPMIARELQEFFAGMSPPESPPREPVVQGPEDPVFLSNVNACYRADVLRRIGFRDVPYAEDQAFARDLLAAGMLKAYVPGAAVLHAHDYPWVEFMRRYFDEYRGLRQTLGHVEPAAVGPSLRHLRDQVVRDDRWLSERGAPPRARARWGARAIAHHGGRRVFSVLGSRSERLPASVRGRLSLEGRDDGAPLEVPEPPVETGGATSLPPFKAIAGTTRARSYRQLTERMRLGPAPLLDPVPGMAERTPLHIAVVVPPFGRGSGGHSSIFQIVSGLERLGHTCSIWLDDAFDHQYEKAGHLRGAIRDWFAPIRGPAFKGFDDWYGADVAVATGWQTVYPVLGLDQVRARAYLVHDHENEFYATSVESLWARRTYDEDLFCICSSPWLLGLTGGYGRRGSVFRFGVDHETYFPRPVTRSEDMVVFYARATTPRRAVPLGICALEELKRRRPSTRIVLFGWDTEQWTSFDHEHVGVVAPRQLSWLYSRARAGLCLSLTNHSLIPQEMLACGLPCVDLAGISSESVYGDDGALELAEIDPIAIADALERLLDDPEVWQRRSAEGLRFVAGRTWDESALEVEAGLRAALREREPAPSGAAGAGQP